MKTLNEVGVLSKINEVMKSEMFVVQIFVQRCDIKLFCYQKAA